MSGMRMTVQQWLNWTMNTQLGRPFWVDDPTFNLAYHVRHSALPAPTPSQMAGPGPQGTRAAAAVQPMTVQMETWRASGCGAAPKGR